jgi:hypothetical protein
MNAKDSVIWMKNRLAEAGFIVQVLEETDNKVTYSISNNTDNVWETKQSFYLSAKKYDFTNRWNKYFSYSRDSISDHVYRNNLTYNEMNHLISYATLRTQSTKVGA